ncbi:MAG: amidohydrolase family protein, partial [Vicinamibacteria bacterium]
VVRRYGWAHSFFLEGEPVGAGGERGREVTRAYRATKATAPFLVHLAEGVDRRARQELSRLEELGCLGENTVLVHGVGVSCEEWTYARSRGAGLVWCPSSNLFLLGQTAAVREFLHCAPASRDWIALGTDSRLSGSRDLLDEIREARRISNLAAAELLRMVTTNAARLLRLPAAGRLARGLPADLLVIPRLASDPADALLAARRDQVQLVALGGRPAIAAPQLSKVFAARRVRTESVKLDGKDRILARRLARAIRSCPILEPGLELEEARSLTAMATTARPR